MDSNRNELPTSAFDVLLLSLGRRKKDVELYPSFSVNPSISDRDQRRETPAVGRGID